MRLSSRAFLFSTASLSLLLTMSPTLLGQSLQPSVPAYEQMKVEATTFPPECARDVSEDTGQPVVFLSERGLIWALSIKSPVSDKERIPVVLWVCNTTDQVKGVATCSTIGSFWKSIAVFDLSGQELSSLDEERYQQERRNLRPGEQLVCLPLCSRNFLIQIPPHMSRHGRFSERDGDFVLDLRQSYSLPAGQYFIALAGWKEADCTRAKRKLSDSEDKISLLIEAQ